MTSPELTGGAGFTYEDAVAAHYFAAIVAGTTATALGARVVQRVAQQQADFGEPLDDVIVDAASLADGTVMRLSLQVKRSLTISDVRTFWWSVPGRHVRRPRAGADRRWTSACGLEGHLDTSQDRGLGTGRPTHLLPAALARKLLQVLDALVDLGDRRSAALQQSESFRGVRLAGQA
jgi:hypothetical protein